MIKIFIAFFSFLLELLVDKKEELSFNSPYFDPRKIILVLIISITLFYSGFVTKKLFKAALKIQQLEQQLTSKNKIIE